MNTVGAYEYRKLIRRHYMTYMSDLNKLQFEFLVGKLGGSLETEIPRFADIFDFENKKEPVKEEEPEEIIGNIRTKLSLFNKEKGE